MAKLRKALKQISEYSIETYKLNSDTFKNNLPQIRRF